MGQDFLPIRGLWTSGNRLTAPKGALKTADQLLLRRGTPGNAVAESRRGMPQWSNGTWAAASNCRSIYGWVNGGSVYVYEWNADGSLYRTTDGTTYTSVGTYTNPAGGFWVRFVEAGKNLYFTTSAGPYRQDSGAGTPVVAGIQKPLSISTTSSAATGAGFTTPGAVAYRATLALKDANGNVHESAPSPRGIYRWSAATDAVDVTVQFAASLSASYLIRLYRSAQVTATEDEPSDEMGLVYERFLTSGEVTAKSVTISDIVPDVMRGATGYFCPSQEGLRQGNERPPLAKDLAWFGDCMFYANTTSKHRLTLRLLSVSGTNGIAANDTVTIAGVTYTAKAGGAVGDQFNLVTGFTSAQADIQGTTINLVNAINASSNNSTVYAYYMSGPDDPAGIFMIEERSLGGNSFAATSAAGGANCSTSWAPELPTSGTTVSSTNDDAPNRLYFSKPHQPEAVPVLNYVDVGSRADRIFRIMSVRGALYVFKERDGIFRVTGSGGAFSVREHDTTVHILGQSTLAPLNNELFCLSDKGAVAVSDVGVRVLSGPLEDDLRPWKMADRDDIQNACAIGHEEDGYYAVFLPPNLSLVAQAFVYFPATDAWTTWSSIGGNTVQTAAAMVPLSATMSGLKLYVSGDGSQYLRAEARTDADADYSDGGGIAVSPVLDWQRFTAGSPGVWKTWTRADFFLQDSTITAASARFATELDTSTTSVTLAPTSGALLVTSPIPTSKQTGAALTVGLTHTQDAKKFVCVGVDISYEGGGDMAGR